MELKHWHMKFKVGEIDREMKIDGDAIQTEDQAKAHVKRVFPEALFADDAQAKTDHE